MRCIFCRQHSSSSRSVEHILPEALGNSKQVLPPGVVCDQCNNYFSREVERPFLDLEAIRIMRHHQVLPSKRGSVPSLPGLLWPDIAVVSHRRAREGIAAVLDVPTEAFERVLRGEVRELILPVDAPVLQGRALSRFCAKVALEVMALRTLDNDAALASLVDDPQLHGLRHHARKGWIKEWPVHVRRVYDANQRFTDANAESFQVMHEFDILCTEQRELYCVLILFGREFTINIGGPELTGYNDWLERHGGASPLYVDKNACFTPARP